MIDIHCHLLPGMDDGSTDWETSLAMARIAVTDGISTIIATPHQGMGNQSCQGDLIRTRTLEMNELLRREGLPLQVFAGGEIRIDSSVVSEIRSGRWLTLADQGRHVLLELPHELFFSPEPILEALRRAGMVGILAHIERNEGALADPRCLEPLIHGGCFFQVTASSLLGKYGREVQELAEWLFKHKAVHFVASDAHGPKRRTPRLREAYDWVARHWGEATAKTVFYDNPLAVLQGEEIVSPTVVARKKPSLFGRWVLGRKAG